MPFSRFHLPFVCSQTRACTCAHMCPRTHTRTHTHMHARTHARTRTHTHAHIHAHTHTLAGVTNLWSDVLTTILSALAFLPLFPCPLDSSEIQSVPCSDVSSPASSPAPRAGGSGEATRDVVGDMATSWPLGIMSHGVTDKVCTFVV